MYLNRKVYVPFEKKVKEIGLINKSDKTEEKIELEENETIYSFDIECIYWRKANQIHRWFVENIQNGVDDCGEYAVKAEQLEKLYLTIERILEEKDEEKRNELAEKLLPTQPGFFFGDTGYNQWYFEDLEYTLKALKPYLERDDEGEFVYKYFRYQSSW